MSEKYPDVYVVFTNDGDGHLHLFSAAATSFRDKKVVKGRKIRKCVRYIPAPNQED